MTTLWDFPVARRFLISQGAGQMADAVTAAVLAATLLGDGGSGVDPDRLLSTLGAAIVPYLIAGPVSGVAADRWRRRRALAVVNVLRAAMTLAAIGAVVVGSYELGLIAAVFLLSLARFVLNLRAAAVPHTVSADDLVALDAAGLRVGMFAVGVGGALGAAVATVAPSPALAVAAFAQLCSAYGFGGIGVDLGGGSRQSRRWATERWPLAGNDHVGFLVIVVGLQRLLLGGLFATLVLLASNRYGFGTHGYLFALVVTGAGSFAGTFTADRWHRLFGTRGVVALAWMVPASLLIGLFAVPSPAAVSAALGACFFVFQNVRVLADASVQTAVADRLRARVFALYDAFYNATYYLGAAGAIALTAHARPGLLIWIGVLYLAVTPAVMARLAVRPLTQLGSSS